MRLSVYNSGLTRIGLIYNWISLIWEAEYNGPGKVQLELRQSDEVVALLRPGNIIKNDDSDCPMIVESMYVKDKKVVAIGSSAAHVILSRRVSTAVISNANAETALRGLVSNMTPWGELSLGTAAGLTDVYTAQTSDGTIYEYCEKICTALDIGFRVRMDSGQLLFELYKPPLREDVIYSTKYGNLGDLVYTVSDADFRNVAYVDGAEVGGTRLHLLVGETDKTGAERAEMYIDARDIAYKDDDTAETYAQKLGRRGIEKLAEQLHIESVEFNISDANLGDVISIRIPEFELALTARVVTQTVTSQANEVKTAVEVGTPLTVKRRRI